MVQKLSVGVSTQTSSGWSPTKNSSELPLLSLWYDPHPAQSFANQHDGHSFHIRNSEHLNKATPKALERILPIVSEECSMTRDQRAKGSLAAVGSLLTSALPILFTSPWTRICFSMYQPFGVLKMTSSK